jgi:hypothetical protein
MGQLGPSAMAERSEDAMEFETCSISLEMSIVYQSKRRLEKNSHDARHLHVMVRSIRHLETV